MIPAPFTNGADLQTDWLFEYFLDHHNGQYKPHENAIIFRGGDEDFYYEMSVEMFSNAFRIKLIAGDYLDNEFIGNLLNELLEDIDDKESTLCYEINYDVIHDIVTVLFYYKDDE